MKIMKVNSVKPKTSVIRLARTINATKQLPSDMTKDSVNKMLALKSAKLYGSTLMGVLGIPASFTIMANTLENGTAGYLAGVGLFMASSLVALFKSLNNREVEEAYSTINDGKDIAEDAIKYTKEAIKERKANRIAKK